MNKKLVENILLDTKESLNDEKIRNILKERHGIAISRRSVNDYRKELKKAGREYP